MVIPNKNNALLFMVIGVCVYNLIEQLNTLNYQSLFNSAIGIASVVLFFFNKNSFKQLLWIWIALQAVVIEREVINTATNVTNTIPVLDFTQVRLLTIKAGFRIVNKINGDLSIDFNFITILYSVLFGRLKTNSLIGKRLKLVNTFSNQAITSEDELLLTIKNNVNIDGNSQWLMGNLDKEISINGQPTDTIIVQADKGLLSNTFLTIKTNAGIVEGTNTMDKFQKIEGIMIDSRGKSIYT